MRNGDFGVEVVAVQGDDVREVDSGHVLARPGAVYAVRLRNFGPLRCVVDVHIDGKRVTAGGLVLNPYSATTLERPVDASEHGRFTVVAEGDERVFGPDGGRDNAALGLIEGSFRRELPNPSVRDVRPLSDTPTIPLSSASRPMAPPEWSPFQRIGKKKQGSPPDVSAIAPIASSTPGFVPPSSDMIERAAGTGLTGHSDQRVEMVVVGKLESEATVLQLRLVIGSDEAFSAPRPLRPSESTPARPAARP